MNLTNENINRTINLLESAKALFKHQVQIEQIACEHKHQAECNYKKYEVLDYCDPPKRICLDCGLTEEGWGCAYIVLSNQSPFVGNIDRNVLNSLHVGLNITDEMKGPLLRKEKTLEQMIQEN